jgi:MinD-like ATPase involved in chromosome partitioning or flagellar assembly
VKTITFYSYKGGSGRSLTVANAALYLQRLDFRVTVIDFDLEAPGMHYKFAFDPETGRIPVTKGLVDYVYEFVVNGQIPDAVSEFSIPLSSGGVPDLTLIAAGDAPTAKYWQKLSRINWHELFYSNLSHGVELFFDLKNKIERELKPDFLLVDSRTGITETGGVATSLLADRIICLVSPSRENLEGARSVLQSVNRTRRGYQAPPVEITIALSRLPEMEKVGGESEVIKDVLKTLNRESESLEDTLHVTEDDAVTLHSENALEIREALRVGSGVSPEDSILLRDYLRLFASIVPPDLVSAKLHSMLAKAREKIWDSPSEAVKEVEELAESFGHPDTYRELLRFYEVRSVGGIPVLRRAQRLWEITRDSHDQILWKAVAKNFVSDSRLSRRRETDTFQPRDDFVESVWRDGGDRDAEFGLKLSDYYERRQNRSSSIAILQELIEHRRASPKVVAACVRRLLESDRTQEARILIERFNGEFGSDPTFVLEWAEYAVLSNDADYIKTLTTPQYFDSLRRMTGSIAPLRLLAAADRKLEARDYGERLLTQFQRDSELLYRTSRDEMLQAAETFAAIGLGQEIIELLDRYLPDGDIERLRRRFKIEKS